MIELLISIINKLLWMGLAFSAIDVLRVVYLFIRNFRRNPPQPFVLSRRELITLGVCIAFIIMTIFTGITL